MILLDIGLPNLNGVEAARRIRALCPAAKIIFVMETRSSEIASEALPGLATGYVIKAAAGSELLPAITAVLGGKQFVSADLRVAMHAQFGAGSQS